jgi:adenylate cyclase
MHAMPIWGNKASEKQSALSADFGHALTREILSTELLRVKATLATITLLVATFIVTYAISPDTIERIWHGRAPVLQLAVTFVPFVLFELSVLRLVSARLAQGRDVPYARRYLGALIETSLPTVGLYLEMKAMGPAQALAFAVPLAYFIFIILSTLRLDFWLSTFTGFVAAAELFAMAMFYHPAQFVDEPAPAPAFHIIRSLIILTCGMLAGAVGVQLRRQFAASIQAATARDRVTDLFGQHVSPQVVERLMVSASTASDIAGCRHVRRFPQLYRDHARSRRRWSIGSTARSRCWLNSRPYGGIVNKFLGVDSRLFGAPFEAADAAQRAVAAARKCFRDGQRQRG